MILKTEQDSNCIDIEVNIRFAQMNKCIERLIHLIRSTDIQIKCSGEDREYLVTVSDIYYIESVDKRTFVYLENKVYRTNFRLYQLAAHLSNLGFVQISKSCILNINTLASMRQLMNSRMEATLKNGERLYITRKYLGGIKKALQGGAVL